jgi:hypothetical protein
MREAIGTTTVSSTAQASGHVIPSESPVSDNGNILSDGSSPSISPTDSCDLPGARRHAPPRWGSVGSRALRSMGSKDDMRRPGYGALQYISLKVYTGSYEVAVFAPSSAPTVTTSFHSPGLGIDPDTDSYHPSYNSSPKGSPARSGRPGLAKRAHSMSAGPTGPLLEDIEEVPKTPPKDSYNDLASTISLSWSRVKRRPLLLWRFLLTFVVIGLVAYFVLSGLFGSVRLPQSLTSLQFGRKKLRCPLLASRTLTCEIC